MTTALPNLREMLAADPNVDRRFVEALECDRLLPQWRYDLIRTRIERAVAFGEDDKNDIHERLGYMLAALKWEFKDLAALEYDIAAGLSDHQIRALHSDNF